jgi:hypothetical protein
VRQSNDIEHFDIFVALGTFLALIPHGGSRETGRVGLCFGDLEPGVKIGDYCSGTPADGSTDLSHPPNSLFKGVNLCTDKIYFIIYYSKIL